MDADFLSALSSFDRRAEAGEGYGLGLSLVRQIVRAHGGEVRCLPRDGGGTVFEVELPTPRAA